MEGVRQGSAYKKTSDLKAVQASGRVPVRPDIVRSLQQVGRERYMLAVL
jgi:hypothetical protein